MPEELAIALVILVAVGWIVVKIFQALGRFVQTTHKTSIEAVARSKSERFVKKKSQLSRYVQVVLPNELEEGDKQLCQAELMFRL